MYVADIHRLKFPKHILTSAHAIIEYLFRIGRIIHMLSVAQF